MCQVRMLEWNKWAEEGEGIVTHGDTHEWNERGSENTMPDLQDGKNALRGYSTSKCHHGRW